MKAAVFRGPGELGLEDVAPPTPGPGEVLLAVEGCGICGTDLHIYRGEAPARVGNVLGHEYGGRVLRLGDGVEGLSLGTRVAVDPNLSCGFCPPCRDGKNHLCLRLQALGIDLPGGFAEEALVPAKAIYPFPEEFPYGGVALVEPLACALHAIDLTEMKAGEEVLILGAGPMGLLMVLLASARGAARVTVADPLPERLMKAAELGAVVCRPGEEANGYDVVIEAAGTPAALETALEAAKRGGMVLLFGVHPAKAQVTFSPYNFYRREIRLVSSFTNPGTTRRAIAVLAAGKAPFESILGKAIALEDLPTYLAHPPAGAIGKTVVYPNRYPKASGGRSKLP